MEYTYNEIEEIDHGSGNKSIDSNILHIDTNKKTGVFLYDLFLPQKKATIFYLEVWREHRNKGISQEIIDQFVCDMKCKGIETIDLRYIDETAKKIWERLGFKKEEGIRMERNISSEKCECINQGRD